MKLYIYDRKHDQVNHELELGNISEIELNILLKVFQFFDEKGFTNKYRDLQLANGYKIEEIIDEEDGPTGESQIFWED